MPRATGEAKCRRPSTNTPDLEEKRADRHKKKMMGKFFRNKEFGDSVPETEFQRLRRLARVAQSHKKGA